MEGFQDHNVTHYKLPILDHGRRDGIRISFSFAFHSVDRYQGSKAGQPMVAMYTKPAWRT